MTTELVILRGVSGSGKSTYARTLIDTHVIVSRDLIRPGVSGVPGKQLLDNAGERRVTVMQDAAIRGALSKGLSVVVDDTNIALRNPQRFAKIAVELNVPWRVVDFEVPLEVARERNAQRPEQDRVPDEVVVKQHRRANFSPVQVDTPIRDTYVQDVNLLPAILVDLDGTLCLLPEGFSPFDPAHYAHDNLNTAVAEVIYMAENAGVEVIYFSGREGTRSNRSATIEWLAERGLNGHPLHMRPEGDTRNDAVVKMEMFDEHIQDNYNVLFTLDDRDRVVAAWRARGIPCFQVNPGAF